MSEVPGENKTSLSKRIEKWSQGTYQFSSQFGGIVKYRAKMRLQMTPVIKGYVITEFILIFWPSNCAYEK